MASSIITSKKGRPNLSVDMHKSLSGLIRPNRCRPSFRASSNCAS